MRRRKFITNFSVISIGTLKTNPFTNTETENSNEDELSCEEVETLPTVDEGDSEQELGNPAFIAEGEKSVKAYWKNSKWFKEDGHEGAIAIGVINGETIVFNEKYKNRVTDDVVAHELAHTLGYRHEDDEGIVDPNTVLLRVNDKHPYRDLNKSTNDVVTTFDAYTPMYDWDADDLGKVVQMFGEGKTSASVLGHAVTRFAEDNRGESFIYNHSFDGFGGRFDNSFQSGKPDNVYKGHFYGLNSTR